MCVSARTEREADTESVRERERVYSRVKLAKTKDWTVFRQTGEGRLSF